MPTVTSAGVTVYNVRTGIHCHGEDGWRRQEGLEASRRSEGVKKGTTAVESCHGEDGWRREEGLEASRLAAALCRAAMAKMAGGVEKV